MRVLQTPEFEGAVSLEESPAVPVWLPLAPAVGAASRDTVPVAQL